MHKVDRLAVLAVLPVAMLSGCGGAAAALDLIAVARKGIAREHEATIAVHEQLIGQLKARQAALDSAFDADVNLAAAGRITNASGEAVGFSPRWVISARKGYIAARDAVAGQIADAEASHQVRSDNFRASDEALEMAGNLIVQQAMFGRQVKQYLIQVQRRLIGDRPAD